MSRPTAGLPTPVAAQLANRHAELAETYAASRPRPLSPRTPPRRCRPSCS
jgi:hypothetical protein